MNASVHCTTAQRMSSKPKQARCCICGRPESAKKPNGQPKRLAIDHCHVSGAMRGLLCQRCNTGLGMFDDDIVRLFNAIKYLRLSR